MKHMSETGERRRGRVHDAEGTREAILNAAEAVFAAHGFDGARIDAIAAEAGYNKSLIFHYFGDKLGLYAAVLRRADREMYSTQVQVFASLADEAIVTDAHRFKQLLKTGIVAFFDYMIEHPRFMHIMAWEMAAGWQTFARVISERDREDMVQFRALLYRAQDAGLLRPGFDPAIQLTLSLYHCLYYPLFTPMFQMLLPDEDFGSPSMLASAREFFVESLITGVVVDTHEDFRCRKEASYDAKE
jgi:TetR/AcrR family transcriptional regulator